MKQAEIYSIQGKTQSDGRPSSSNQKQVKTQSYSITDFRVLYSLLMEDYLGRMTHPISSGAGSSSHAQPPSDAPAAMYFRGFQQFRGSRLNSSLVCHC